MGERRHLLTLGDMLPIRVVVDLLGGLRQASLRAGCAELTIDSGLRVHAVLPEPGSRVEYHEVTLAPSEGHADMVSWSCSCGEQAAAASSFGDVGGATFYATGHIPAGEAWSVVPARALWAAEG